jgi:hypothetical protein
MHSERFVRERRGTSVTRRRLSEILARVGLGLTACCALALCIGFPARGYLHALPVDLVLFVLVWAYIIATPICGMGALVLGDRSTKLVRASYAIVAIWFLAVASMSIITF